MSKVKLILIGLAAGLNIALAAYCGWLHVQWNYHRPIITEQHITQQYINSTGSNATIAQNPEPKSKDKSWFVGAYGGYKTAGVVAGKMF